jgi:hypothetical protein
VRVAVEVERLAVVVVVVLLALVVLLEAVVLLAAVVLGVAAAVAVASTLEEPVPLVTEAAVALAVPAIDWRAMPRPRALAMPMLSDATSARLRAAGWGRFVLMGDERTDRP